MKLYRSITNIDKNKQFTREMRGINGSLTIEEKIDGSNINFFIDWTERTVKVFSRTQEITDNLWEGLEPLYLKLKERLKQRDILGLHEYRYQICTGEWLGQAKLPYNKALKNKLFLFDIAKTNNLEGYLNGNTSDVKTMKRWELELWAGAYGVEVVPVLGLIDDDELSLERIKEFAEEHKKSKIFDCEMEGLVIKFADSSVKFKYVNPKFKERMGIKPAKVVKQKLINIKTTEFGINKYITKLKDQGLLPKDWDPSDKSKWGIIFKNLSTMAEDTFNECKEEILKLVMNEIKDSIKHDLTRYLLGQIQ